MSRPQALDDTAARRAVLTANMETALNAVAGMAPGARANALDAQMAQINGTGGLVTQMITNWNKS